MRDDGCLRSHTSVGAIPKKWGRSYPNLFAFESVPVNTPKPGVVQHVSWPTDEVTQPLCTIWVEEGLDELLGQPVHLLGPIDLPPQDLLVDPWGGFIEKRREADHHFISKDTACPPVGRLAVTFIKDDLWGEVFGGSTQGPSTIFNNLCKPKISEPQVTSGIE